MAVRVNGHPLSHLSFDCHLCREERYLLEAAVREVVEDPGRLMFVSLPIDLSSTSNFAIVSSSCSAIEAYQKDKRKGVGWKLEVTKQECWNIKGATDFTTEGRELGILKPKSQLDTEI